MMKRKGLLCLLALFLLIAGFMLSWSYHPGASVAPKAAAQSTISAHPQTVSLISTVPSDQEDAASPAIQTHLSLEVGIQFSHLLATTRLLVSNPGTWRISNAVLLPAIDRLIGLSHLVLRE